jgi:pimeloyl-ACP methyl ester carboxylesterase
VGDVATDASPSGARSPNPTTLLLCDGLGCDGYVWKYLQWALSSTYRLVHFHYRGHGQSQLPADLSHITLSDFTRDALTVLDACGIEQAVLCGHSMGVQVALEAYKQAPERVAGLVLICGSYGNPLRTFKGSDRLESLLPVVRAAVSRVPSLVSALWRRAIPTELSYYLAQRIEIDGQLVRKEDFFPYLEGVARMDPRMFVCTLAAAGQHNARELLPTIQVPTLIVAGRRDSFTPMELSRQMQREVPQAELHVVEQGTHTAPIERPAEVTEVIADFLRRRVQVSSRSGAAE